MPGFLFDGRDRMSEDVADEVIPDEVIPGDVFAEPLQVVVEDRAHGWRVDHYLTRLYPNFSRAAFQRVIDDGAVLVNGLPVKMSRRLHVNDSLQFRLPTTPDHSLMPEDIPLDVLYDDDALIVINKAANMIVHPGKGNYGGTLAGALQFRFDKLSDQSLVSSSDRFAEKYLGIVSRTDSIPQPLKNLSPTCLLPIH